MKELKIRLKSPQISIKNGLIPETHSRFPPGENDETVEYGVRYPANTIDCTISPWSILGYLRYGVTQALIEKGVSVCHSYDLNLPGKDYRTFVEQDLAQGYHRKAMKDGEYKGKPECEAVMGEMCIVAEIFGTFTGSHRVFSLMPVKVSPIDSEYTRGVKNVTGKGNYLKLAISPRSAVDGTPYATHTVNVIENLDAILYIKMYEPNTRMDVHVAVLLMGINYLNDHQNDFKHQLGGGRTFGSGFIEATALPTEMTRQEIVKYHGRLIKLEDKADDSDDLSKETKEKIERWDAEKTKYAAILEKELKDQKERFGIDKKWWQTK